jgi:predicted membrane channel-forming protein YqfA (hemolysin III family)
MAMENAMLVIVVAALLLGFFGWHRSRAVRAAARWISGVLFLVLLAATLALLYGSFAWSSKGGGVLILFALPLGVVTWIAGSAFFSSAQAEDYYDLPTEEKMASNLASLDESLRELRESVARKIAERNRLFISSSRREQLRREIAHEQMMLEKLPQLRAGLEKREAYE